MVEDASRRRPAAAVAFALSLVVALTGCTSTQTPDPALTAAVSDALTAGRSAQLALELSADDRILPTTVSVLLGDMAESLAGSASELELAQPTGDESVRYRSDALAATRVTLEALHAAQQRIHSAPDDLDAALHDLETLAKKQ